MIEKRTQDVLPKVHRRVAAKLQSAERTVLSNLLAVMPWAQHQKDLFVVRILWLDGLVDRDVSVDIFLIPKAMNQHDRNFQRLLRQQFINGLSLPERVVARMFEQL